MRRCVRLRGPLTGKPADIDDAPPLPGAVTQVTQVAQVLRALGVPTGVGSVALAVAGFTWHTLTMEAARNEAMRHQIAVLERALADHVATSDGEDADVKTELQAINAELVKIQVRLEGLRVRDELRDGRRSD